MARKASVCRSCASKVLEGIDYNATIFLGSHQLGASRGQYMSMTFDVTALLKRGAPHEIAVLFHPPPKEFLDQWLAPGNAVQGAMSQRGFPVRTAQGLLLENKKWIHKN